MKKGFFLSFEGIEGTGKSTQASLLFERLREKGFDVVLTEEPGGTKIGRKIREILLSPDHQEITPLTELFLYFASRTQHLAQVIIPAVNRGAVVITDRFTDSTIAYQGYGRGIALHLLHSLDNIATKGMQPDITLLLDLDVETGLRRNKGINKTDRIELEDIGFHKRVRNGFLELAAQQPERIRLIDASLEKEEVRKRVLNMVLDMVSS
ncbi:MAG: dTMP kinase [Thermodesulfovibrionales bacterium]|nr:dTMP kinase [Thermodesulfovibrionales bacterium]